MEIQLRHMEINLSHMESFNKNKKSSFDCTQK
jgi:hypothetical protein